MQNKIFMTFNVINVMVHRNAKGLNVDVLTGIISKNNEYHTKSLYAFLYQKNVKDV